MKTGGFIFEGLSPGNYLIHGQLNSHSSRVVEVDLRARKEVSKLDVVLIDCSAEIGGVVRDPWGGFVGGARISVRGGIPTNSAGDGSYRLCVHRGRAMIEVLAQGYARELLPLYIRGSESVDFTLIPEATVEGRVVAARGGLPVEDAIVTVKPLRSGEVRERKTATNASGVFRFSNLMPGAYQYSAYSAGLATRFPDYFVASAGAAEQLTCVLDSVGVVRGRVTLPSGEPADAVRINAISGDRRFVATSDHNGTFNLELPDGRYRLSSESHELFKKDDGFEITGSDTVGVSLVVKRPGSLTGTTSLKGRPIPNAAVVGRSQFQRVETISDQNGQFVFSVLPIGRYELSGETAERFGRTSIELTDAVPDQNTVLVLEYGASVSGRVLTEDYKPMSGALIEFSRIGEKDFGYAISDRQGYYRAGAMVGQGRYSVQVRLSQSDPIAIPFASDAPSVVLNKNRVELEGVDLIVSGARRSIVGQVVYADGSPVPWVEVQVRGLSKEPWPATMRTRTGADGHFKLNDVPDVALGVFASTLETQSQVRKVERGDVVLRLVLPKSGSIAGKLVGFQSVPEVRACNERFGCFSARVHEDRFRFIGIPNGQYDLMAASQETSAVGRVDLADQPIETKLEAVGSAIVELRFPETFRWPRDGIRCHWLILVGHEASHPMLSLDQANIIEDGPSEFRIPAGESVVIQCDNDSEVLRASANFAAGSRTTVALSAVSR
jgi:hypothetical protein